MSLRIEVDYSALRPLLEDAKRAGANAEKLMRAALINSTSKIQSEARSRAPHRTGTLQRSILAEVSYPDALVAVNERYGAWIEEGTGIYGPTGQPIVPRTAKVLAWKSGGQAIFARSVKGIKARPFFKPAILASESFMREQFDKVVMILTQELRGR